MTFMEFVDFIWHLKFGQKMDDDSWDWLLQWHGVFGSIEVR